VMAAAGRGPQSGDVDDKRPAVERRSIHEKRAAESTGTRNR
jgi:hypothetical protein